MQALPLATPTPSRAPAPSLAPTCGVCGCGEVHTDEVTDETPVRLAACARCDHRWTERLAPAPAPAAVRRVRRAEMRPAA